MNYISDVLYWISTGLLVPVVVLLVLFFLRSLLLLGSFFGQYVSVRRTQGAVESALEGLTRDNVLEVDVSSFSGTSIGKSIGYVVEHAGSRPHIDRELSRYEASAEKDMSTSRTLAKMSPMLGLMGTLIPMGPALVGLSSGDMQTMAYNMQVAFATTVVGLFAAAIGMVTLQVKRRWYRRDMEDLQFVADLVDEKEGRAR